MKVHPYRFLKYCTTLLVLLLLVTNCEQEHEIETLAQNNNDFEIRKIDYNEILKIENLKEPFEKIKGSLVVEKDIFNKTYYSQENDSDKIQIVIDKAIEVKTDGYESYSFKVINPNLEKSSFENLIIERYDDSDFKYFIYTYDTEDNGENSREIVDIKRKEVTADQINLSDFSNPLATIMVIENCLVDQHVDFDSGCTYVEIIICWNGGGGGSGEGDSDNNDNDGSDNDNGNNNNTGDSDNGTGGSGGGSGGSGEGGGKNHPIIGVIDDLDPCPEGYIKDKDGNCVEQPCSGDPVPNPEIVPQYGKSGTKGALHGCTRYGVGCTSPDGRTKLHNGIDLKNDYGEPIYAMYSGFIYTTKHDPEGAGYYTRIQSTVNGETFLVEYYHLQSDNRILQGNPLVQVNAGDIIGYQGDSGNLKGAIADGTVDSHVHIEVRVHDGSSQWGYSNFNPVDPRDYINTIINTDGTSEENTDCNN